MRTRQTARESRAGLSAVPPPARRRERPDADLGLPRVRSASTSPPVAGERHPEQEQEEQREAHSGRFCQGFEQAGAVAITTGTRLGHGEANGCRLYPVPGCSSRSVTAAAGFLSRALVVVRSCSSAWGSAHWSSNRTEDVHRGTEVEFNAPPPRKGGRWTAPPGPSTTTTSPIPAISPRTSRPPFRERGGCSAVAC